jgi:hypothetical protein
MAAITQEQYDSIKKAANTLCDYCEADECNYCIVNRLVDDATNEAIESGIIEND